ncbi:Ubiquitin carboxyl-terminal hydrolase 16 [Cyberlindnera fabianii]|uniref:Ubiquitin carboxyl-terminal hydrolase 16 n=1 Tax=Cyberlindnera fabianii TaxID=36022 RepID=A0A1V2LAV7_CYBFA|nr:Ubiquitin carboxyl-terminal hydrolase 16 [Cyberlindnera fabianii]
MFSSKRQDKHTTGLINTRNDCFANSSVQAFAALPGLNTYLNEMIKQHQLMDSLPLPKDDPAPGIPLHLALADIVATLQEPITSSKEVSVWPFLQVIEKIFSSKISTNQNDAHELVQLILETLDNETTKLKKYAKKHKLNLLIPELPFNGLLADQLTCYSCLNSSKPSFHPFSVMSLPVPQERSATLSDMLKTNEVETINGYHCLRCKLKAILKIENEKIEKGIPLNEDEAQIVSKLKVMEPNLTINDDLPEPLEQWVKEYTSQGFKTLDLLSTIVKKTLVVKPPNLLTVHLSRSMFTSNHLTRNSCRVEFEETLTLDVDENLAHATSIGSRENDVEDEEPEDDDNASTNSDALSDELNIIKDKVRYRLRAVIRHQGTHQAGHYECYRHKPLFVKDSSTGKVICLTPKIVGWETDQPPPSSSPVASPTLRHPEPVAEGKPSNFLSPGSTPADSVSRNSDAVESGEEGEGSFSRFRSRLGSIVSRRSSISHSPQPPRDSGGPLPTPNVADITASFEQFDMNAASQDKNKKYKKVSTVSKYPYWRISDTTVNEAKSSQLLAERTAVYMIYYERVGH